MSRSPVSKNSAVNRGFSPARIAQRKLLQQGRSFSGRERNCGYLNTGPGTAGFAEISAVIGLDFADDSRGLARVDWDQDGDLDLWFSNRNAPRLRFLRNDIVSANHFLAVRLEGNGTTTSRDAIGARVELRVAGSTNEDSAQATSRLPLIKTLRAGEGFLTQSSKWLHFGLGTESRVESIIVQWPGSDSETFFGAEADHRYILQQGTGKTQSVESAQRPLALAASKIEVPLPPTGARIPLVTLMPVPRVNYMAADGARQPLPIGRGKPVLVNLWATWCPPCVEELREIAQRRNEFQQRDLEVIAICMDALGGPKANLSLASEFLDEIEFPFVRGRATEEFVGVFRAMHNQLVVNDLELPAPTSFLIGPQGRLSIIYEGRFSVDALFADLSHASLSRDQRYQRLAGLPGRVVDSPILNKGLDTLELINILQFSGTLKESGRFEDAKAQLHAGLQVADHAAFRSNLGAAMLEENRLDEARMHLDRAIKLNPDYAAAHMNLGNVFVHQGRLDEAIGKYEKTLQLDPGFAVAHYNLGRLLAEKKRFPEAISHYRDALRLDPELAKAHSQLGDTLQLLGRFDEALEEYQNSVRINPNDAEAYNGWGVVLAKQGRLPEATTQFQHAVRLNPNYAEARENLRRSLALQEKSDGLR